MVVKVKITKQNFASGYVKGSWPLATLATIIPSVLFSVLNKPSAWQVTGITSRSTSNTYLKQLEKIKLNTPFSLLALTIMFVHMSVNSSFD